MSNLLDKFLSREEGSASRNFLLSAVWWSLWGMGAGLFAAMEFSNPDLVHNIPQFSMPHLRMWHVNAVAIGWLSMGYVSSIFYMVPNLCKTKLYSERLGNFTMWAWNLVMVAAMGTLLNGNTEGREYAELGAILDVLVVIALCSVTFNIVMTVAHRKVQKLYVSLWYFLGSLFWFPLVYIIGQRTFVALPGLNDAIVGWFYGHNILGMWFTTVGVGMMYYLIPRFTQAPLYSHGLSMLGFWGIALFYAPTGTHHITQSPVPEWLKAIAIISSIFLLVPVLTVLTNFFMTMKGKWQMVVTDLPLRFAATSCIFYLITCTQGPFQATRWVNWYLHFTQWVVGHAHLALLGTFSFILTSAIYYMLPRLTGREWQSQGLIRAHYWLKFLGFGLMMTSLTIAGLVQSAGWAMGIPVDQWVITLVPYWFLRSISGVMIVTGQCLFAYNIYQTLFGAASAPESPPKGKLKEVAA
ncbi:MAG: cbb3-type cytochrome c oxidase subunit I [Candidatus Melainabacteria bacterium]|nr:MAG: cbb3-type cytochrome c oxidase subunit I [Candidatus Melainabacteria bacterium]